MLKQVLSKALRKLFFLQGEFREAKKKVQRSFEYNYLNYDIEESSLETIIIVRVYPTNNIFMAKATEVVDDDEMIRKFSPIDVRTICNFAFQDKNRNVAKCTVVGITKSKEKQMVSYRTSKGLKKIPLKKLAFNESLVSKFSSSDALMIGHAFCEENISQEENLFKYADAI